MASIFCAISFVKTVTGSDKICSGNAVYRTGIDEFVEYKFKAFRFSDMTLVEEITKGSLSMIIGRFVFVEGELNVIKNIYEYIIIKLFNKLVLRKSIKLLY